LIFNNKSRQTENQQLRPVEFSDPDRPKYRHPKILLINMKDETEAVLKVEGYNIVVGSFGVPYRVPKDDKLFPVIINGSLPSNYTEREIIVIDLVPADPLSQPKGERHTSPGENDWWANCSDGKIDPRPRLMNKVKEHFDRVFENGGVFIIFADRRDKTRMILGHQSYSGTIKKEQDIYCDSWGFLSILDEIWVKLDHGEKISAVKDFPLGQALFEHIRGGRFLSTLHPNKGSERIKRSWLTLAESKYGEPVAGLIAPTTGKGWLFIFPQLEDKPRFLARLLKDILPELSPHLFPQVEGARWVQRPEYELPEVLELRSQIQFGQETAKQKVLELEKAIEENRAAMGFVRDLIRETGRPLVEAVKQTLETLGFQSVLDVDKEIEKAGEAGAKREDLQIHDRFHDRSPTLLVEVKGISGLPRDSEALQVWKYVASRMKEWNRLDVQALAIINHQRNLPALDRNNASPFREDVLTNAQEQRFGLLTTWDLFKLVRSYRKHGWKHEYIKDLFYQSGRIEPIPKHYEFIGVVEHFWEKAGAVGVRIKTSVLRRGDRIAFELPVEFEEQDVESLQVDNKQVSQAETGMLAGIQTSLHKGQLKQGTRVFRLMQS
jgi:hypothetical protein